jgi:hypothetical protein
MIISIMKMTVLLRSVVFRLLAFFVLGLLAQLATPAF